MQAVLVKAQSVIPSSECVMCRTVKDSIRNRFFTYIAASKYRFYDASHILNNHNSVSVTLANG